MNNSVQDAVGQLTTLGFGDYEARVYVTLLADGPLSGYEVSKRSGVPRPNVYPALQRLEERGAVTAFAAGRGSRYAARPAAELLERLARGYRERLDGAAGSLQRLGADVTEPVTAAVADQAELLARARAMVESATAQVVLAVTPSTALPLADAVRNAVERGVLVTTLCQRACPAPCGSCEGALFRHDIDGPAHEQWLLVVVDDEEALGADLSHGRRASGFVTHHPAMVQMAAASVRDGIAASEIARSLGAGLLTAIDRPAQLALNGPPLADSGRRSWLERIRRRLRSDG
ncbi:MAG: TrmB family transcriptional regulator [Dehalococcoidia bacterium]